MRHISRAAKNVGGGGVGTVSEGSASMTNLFCLRSWEV
jgi:hypothetical protein